MWRAGEGPNTPTGAKRGNGILEIFVFLLVLLHGKRALHLGNAEIWFLKCTENVQPSCTMTGPQRAPMDEDGDVEWRCEKPS
jgi:hypothetical protein